MAVETHIPPSELMNDPHMLKAIVAVLQDRERERKRAQARRGR